MVQATLALAGLAHIFTFGGGDDNTLLHEIAKSTGHQLVILATAEDSWRNVEFKFSSPEEQDRKLESVFRLKLHQSGGVSLPAYPLGVGNQWYFESYRRMFVAPASKARFEDGKLTLQMSGNEACSLSDLGKLNLSKTLQWERFYERVRLKICVKEISESQFVKAVAEAIGAKLVVTKVGQKFVVDPVEHRSRAIAMWKRIQAKPESGFERANADLMIALLPKTEDWLISKAFNEPEFEGGWARAWPAGSDIHTLAWRRPATWFAMLGDEGPANLFRRVAKPDAPVYAYIVDTGCARVGYRNPDTHEVFRF